jgi:LDH2 family malate/lactate/ureidoglycolate dehydrogenase
MEDRMADTAQAEAATAEGAVDPARLRQFTQALFERVGLRSDDAARVADYFVWVELHGRPFVGARRIPEYVARLREGGTRIADTAELAIVEERAGFALVDGRDTLAQITGAQAMELAVEKARLTGVGVVVVRDTTTAGALGYFAMLAAEQGMIGMAINNTPPVMAAWGGTSGAMGAQPFAVASPAGQHPALLLDMTNSAMSMVRMYDAQRRGEQLPEGVALDAEGTPTRDPASAIAGTLLPMGHRGYALALMLEVLTGVLGGASRFGGDVRMPADHANPMAVSLFFLAIDPAAVMPIETFTARVDQLIDQMHRVPTAAGVDGVKVPGEQSHTVARERRERGIPMPDDVVATLRELGDQLGVAW